MRKNYLANYRSERESFARLWQEGNPERILLFSGQSGSGKTSLLHNCCEQIPVHIYTVSLDCQEDGINPAEVFSLIECYVGRERLPELQRQLTAWAAMRQVKVKGNHIEGNDNSIIAVLTSGGEEERKERLVRLTEALLLDISRLDNPLLLLVDTYEKAGADLRVWLRSVIRRLPQACPLLRIVVAGQEVLSTKTCEPWARCCKEYNLTGVPDPEEWLLVVEQLCKRVPADHPIDFLRGICTALQGNPAGIINLIKSFPSLS
ncbi:MAG: ATP-binding protein [Candidatus Electrothrix sp. GM3_4]|nr:ATP-binding protein [Candidatus Electrothrix sp. GM3_4]